MVKWSVHLAVKWSARTVDPYICNQFKRCHHFQIHFVCSIWLPVSCMYTLLLAVQSSLWSMEDLTDCDHRIPISGRYMFQEFSETSLTKSFYVQNAGCLVVDEGGTIESTTLGRIASFYYLKYKTLSVFSEKLGPRMERDKVTSSHRNILHSNTLLDSVNYVYMSVGQ